MSLPRGIELMKYLVAALTLIFSMSGSVNADDHNTRWVLIFASTYMLGEDQKITFQQITQTSADNKISFQDESDCHQGLKSNALRQNETNDNFNKGEGEFVIAVVDDYKFTAKSKKSFMYTEIHCVKIILD